ncbi:MAG: PAS domain S-box protein [Magnetococcus sp. YQC-9]
MMARRSRAWIGLILLLAVMITLGVTGIWWQQKRGNEQQTTEMVAAIEGLLANVSRQQVEVMRAAAGAILRIDSIRAAFGAGDRESLLALSAPLHQELRAGSGITHCYFHRADRINLLRVHLPERHGDRIDRALLKKTEASGQPAFGLEAGPMGTLAWRYVVPWRDGTELIGFLELGMDLDALIASVRQSFPVAVHLFMAKKQLPLFPESIRAGAPLPKEWRPYSDALVIHHDSPEPAAWLRARESDFLNTGQKIWYAISPDDAHFNLARLPLTNTVGEEVAFLLVVHDVTESTHRSQGLIFGGILTGFFCLLAVMRLAGGLVERLEVKLYSARQQEELLGHMLDGSVNPILLFEWPEMTIRQANQGAIDSLGRERGALLRLRLMDLIPESQRALFEERIVPLRDGSRESLGFEAEMIAPDGERFPVDLHLQCFASGAIPLGVAMIQEIGERKRLEEERQRFSRDLLAANAELLDHETSLRMIFEHALEGIITIDIRGRVVDVNPAAESMFGYTREQFLGSDIAELIIPPELRQAHRDALRRLEAVSNEDFQVRKKVELLGLRADGRLLDLELGMSAIYLKGERHFTAIMHDITDRKQLLRSLRETLDVAESVHRMKSEFLANMSHEIRTPMNAIIGLTDLLLNTNPPPDEQRRDLEMIQQSSESLLELINGILDLSKIDAGLIALEKITFDLSGQLEKACESLAVKAYRKELEFYCAIDDDVPPTLVGDPLRLRQVVIHLLSNAIKFTESGEVELRVSRVRDLEVGRTDGVMLRVAVRDTGEGIPPDKQAYIFERFTQLDGSFTRRHGGTGLGLAICKPLIALMEGEIGLESLSGQGSEFHFTARFGVTQRCGSEEADERRAPEAVREPLCGVRVVLADRNATGRRIVGDLLRAAGAAVELVEENDALQRRVSGETLIGEPVDLVVLDHGLLQGDSSDLTGLDRYCSAGGRVLMLVPATLAVGDLSFLDWLRGIVTLRKPVWKYRFLKAVKMALGREGLPQPDRGGESRDEKSGISLEILLVEDLESSRKVAMLILEQAGHAVTCANHADEAIERLKGEKFDLVLMDLELPWMDGVEAAGRIRALGGAGSEEGTAGRVPIIAVTARASTEEERRCQEAGMDGYLSKPYRESELLSVIARVIKRRQMFKCRPEPKNAGAVLKHVDLSSESFVSHGVLFVEQMPRQLDELRRAVQGRNAGGIAKPLQWLGGAARELGAWKVPIQGMRLRGGVEQNLWDEAGESLAKLEGVCQEAIGAIEEKLTALRETDG